MKDTLYANFKGHDSPATANCRLASYRIGLSREDELEVVVTGFSPNFSIRILFVRYSGSNSGMGRVYSFTGYHLAPGPSGSDRSCMSKISVGEMISFSDLCRVRAIAMRDRSGAGLAGPTQPATDLQVGARTLPIIEVAAQYVVERYWKPVLGCM